MIFVVTGTQVNGFDRLIAPLDALIGAGKISQPVVAQIGHGKYIPKHMEYKRFMDKPEYEALVDRADLILSHGGSGALIGALKKGKQVVAVPRQKAFHEALDDHQKQIVSVLCRQGYLRQVTDMACLEQTLAEALEKPITKKYDKPSQMLPLIEKQLTQWFGDKENKG